MIYSGSCRNAQVLLSSCPAINLDITRCDNPGDFIIDVLGLEDEDTEVTDSTSLDQSFASGGLELSEQDSLHASNEFDSFMRPPKKMKPDLSLELSNHFLQSNEYIMLLRAIEGSIRILQRPLDLDFRDLGVRSEAPIHRSPHHKKELDNGIYEEGCLEENENSDEEKGSASIPMMELSYSEDRMVREFVAKSQQNTFKSKPYFSLPSIISDADAGRTSQWAGNWIEVKILQTWVLFARRVTVCVFDELLLMCHFMLF